MWIRHSLHGSDGVSFCFEHLVGALRRFSDRIEFFSIVYSKRGIKYQHPFCQRRVLEQEKDALEALHCFITPVASRMALLLIDTAETFAELFAEQVAALLHGYKNPKAFLHHLLVVC